MICQFCYVKEAMTDDLGEFYIYPDRKIAEGRACCEDCYRGEPGKLHIARYGVGER